MNTKFVDLTELYKLGFHKKIVTQKYLGDQGVCHTKIEKFYWRKHFNKLYQFCNNSFFQFAGGKRRKEAIIIFNNDVFNNKFMIFV